MIAALGPVALIEQDAQAGMQAYLGGRIKVDGDIVKLMLLQGHLGTADAVAHEIAARIRQITA